MAQTFMHAGFSTSSKGVRKLRCSNDPEGRAGTLKGHADTDVQWIELPHPMTRREALAWLTQHELNQGVEKVVNEFRGKKPTEPTEPDPQHDWVDDLK